MTGLRSHRRHHSRRDRLNGQRGETLVEFALGLTLFLATIFGILEFGVAVWQYNMLSDFAQEGARWAMIRGGSNATACTGIGTPPCKASMTDVENYVNSRSVGLNVQVKTYSADATTKVCTTTETNPSTLYAGDGICVKVSKQYSGFTRIVRSGTLTLQSTAQLIMAR